MRLAVDLVVGINALGAIVGFTIRAIRRNHEQRDHDETQRQLEEANRQWDKLNDRMKHGS